MAGEFDEAVAFLTNVGIDFIPSPPVISPVRGAHLVKPLAEEFEWYYRVVENDWTFVVGILMTQKVLSVKDPTEVIYVTFDLAQILESGETIDTEVITASLAWKTPNSVRDEAPSAILSGGPSKVDPLIVQRVIGGLDENNYELRLVVTTNQGRTLVVTAELPVRTK